MIARLVLGRLPHAVGVALASASLAFLLLHVVPGEAVVAPVDTGIGDVRSREASRLAARARLGLDAPLAVQYARFLSRTVRGDLGVSITERRDVRAILAPALANSALLCGTGLVLAVLAGGCVGALQGWRPDSRAGRVLGTALTTLYAVPEFVLATVLIGVLAYRATLFPVGGIADPVLAVIGTPAEQLRDRLWHLVLPAATLALGWGAAVARQQRVGLLEARGADHVRTARAKGVGEAALLRRHALAPSLPGTIAVIGAMLPVVVGGAVVVESLFAWPGMGTLMLRAAGARDYPLLSGAIVVVGFIVSLCSLLVDAAMLRLDPRQRTARANGAAATR